MYTNSKSLEVANTRILLFFFLLIVWRWGVRLYYCDVERDCPQADGDEPAGGWATSHDSDHGVLVNKKSNALACVYPLSHWRKPCVLPLRDSNPLRRLFVSHSFISFHQRCCAGLSLPYRLTYEESGILSTRSGSQVSIPFTIIVRQISSEPLNIFTTKLRMLYVICIWECSREKSFSCYFQDQGLSLIHIWRCRRVTVCRSRWSPYH